MDGSASVLIEEKPQDTFAKGIGTASRIKKMAKRFKERRMVDKQVPDGLRRRSISLTVKDKTLKQSPAPHYKSSELNKLGSTLAKPSTRAHSDNQLTRSKTSAKKASSPLEEHTEFVANATIGGPMIVNKFLLLADKKTSYSSKDIGDFDIDAYHDKLQKNNPPPLPQ